MKIKAGIFLGMIAAGSVNAQGLDTRIILQGNQNYNPSYQQRLYEDQQYYNQQELMYQQRRYQDQMLRQQQDQELQDNLYRQELLRELRQ